MKRVRTINRSWTSIATTATVLSPFFFSSDPETLGNPSCGLSLCIWSLRATNIYMTGRGEKKGKKKTPRAGVASKRNGMWAWLWSRDKWSELPRQRE